MSRQISEQTSYFNKLDIEDINVKAAIAFALLSIALLLALLIYFVFIKH